MSQGVLFFALYLAALFTGQAMNGETPLKLRRVDLLGFLAVWAFFLMLRIFDEHKDFATDLENYPQRVLQRNLVSLTQLKTICVLAIALQLGVSSWLDRGFGPVMISWLVVMVWSGLMATEFFVGQWLTKNLLVYAFSHMLVMPLAVMWMAAMGTVGRWPGWQILALGLVAFCSGFAFEITRKNRAPAEERDSVDSYSRIFGIKGATTVTVVFLLVATAGQFCLLDRLLQGQFHAGWQFGLVLVLLPAILTLLRFVRQPSISGREHNEVTLAVAMLGGYGILIAALIATRGVHF